jgi:hypothetical protein
MCTSDNVHFFLDQRKDLIACHDRVPNIRESVAKLSTLKPSETLLSKPSVVIVMILQCQMMWSPGSNRGNRIDDNTYTIAIKRKGENIKSHFLTLTFPKIKVIAIVIIMLSKGVIGSKNSERRRTHMTTLNALILGFSSFKCMFFIYTHLFF